MTSDFYFSFHLLKTHSFRQSIKYKIATVCGYATSKHGIWCTKRPLVRDVPKTHPSFPFKLLISSQTICSKRVLGFTLTRAFWYCDITMPCLLVLCRFAATQYEAIWKRIFPSRRQDALFLKIGASCLLPLCFGQRPYPLFADFGWGHT